ncbi:pseudouridine synthase [Treponema brennaborense]|uniref:Pseudouridine synthase n=1 Tax=Treponema brennaborense (strain DSM 12168 / CIP 105900 / DD5/3) TaxID=906968 RepID=F4LQ54_TREBD|nr:pseudouridine synthase [Treponema brennaborense]AEE17132.1 pseudouridine synthase Rsu [Treponema brennaborense DSM 12168]
MKTERLDKILSHHGFGSRKDVRKLLHAGSVAVNGTVCVSPDVHVDPDADELTVDGSSVPMRRHIYIMMNKCAGVVCSARDGLHRTVFDLLDDSYRQEFLGGSLHMVGRLDIDTEGLLLLTTDGTLTHRLTSPKTHVTKTYTIRLKNCVPDEAQPLITRRFSDGIHIAPDGDDGEYDCKPADLHWFSGTECSLVITEGRFHQVKRMIAAAGNEVVYLKRIAIGALLLDPALENGAYRELSLRELENAGLI